MVDPNLAQLAAVIAAAGTVLWLVGRGRLAVCAGLLMLAIGEAGLAVSMPGFDALDTLATPPGVGMVALGAIGLALAAGVCVWRPAWVPLAILATAPLRPPIALDASGGFPVTIADDGQLGRLLPLYFVLAAAALALLWRAVATRESAPFGTLPRVIALPAAGFIAFASLSLMWAEGFQSGVELLMFFTLPFALLLGIVARSPLPGWTRRPLAWIAIVMASVIAAVGLFQAATRQVFFFAPNLEVSNNNSGFFRVTSLFSDPSLYGRHVVLGIAVLLVLLALRKLDPRVGIGLLVLLWGGLLFSYSQSSMVALVAVTLAVAAATSGPVARRVVLGGLGLLVVLAVGFVASVAIQGESLRRETADRSQRVADTMKVIEAQPLRGVGIGGQAQASRRLSGRDRPTPNFVSHTTPLTVAAELGLVGLALYVCLLFGGVLVTLAAVRLDRPLGLALGAVLLAVFVHALFYSGFLEDPITWLVLALACACVSWSRSDDEATHAAQAVEAAA